jgi:6-phosphogluconolactonase/glucosamine-6-phosphate isomerase/deaminase
LKSRQSDLQLCLRRIGEDGHLAFNDQSETGFHDPRDVKVVEGQISEECPAPTLRTHPNATLFLETESAAELDLRKMAASAQ